MAIRYLSNVRAVPQPWMGKGEKRKGAKGRGFRFDLFPAGIEPECILKIGARRSTLEIQIQSYCTSSDIVYFIIIVSIQNDII